MIETVLAAIAAFFGTNIDDIFINTIFFAQADSKQEVRAVVVGKYLGMGILVLASLFGAFFLSGIPQTYIGLLGLVPIALGIKEIICNIKSNSQDSPEDLTEMIEEAANFGNPLSPDETEYETKRANHWATIGIGVEGYYEG